MARQSWYGKAYEYSLRYWNALLAGTSLAGVAVFSIVPTLQKYVDLFIFAAANAVVWTVVELKVQMSKPAQNQEHVHVNMRAARPYIVADIERRLARTSKERPMTLTLIGGRMRTMSDIVREVSDDLQRGKVRGHLKVDAFCIDPEFISTRILPGDISRSDQLRRNAAIGRLVASVRAELEDMTREIDANSSISVTVTYYAEDPYSYAYLLNDDLLYWGPFTWDKATSDLLGPENACVVVPDTNPTFPAISEWVRTRTALARARAADATVDEHSS